MAQPRWLLAAAPAAVAALGLVHPRVDPTIGPVASLAERTTLWLAVHLVLPVAIILLALALHRLVADLPGRAAALARWALVPFAVFYSMFDAVVGIATGVLVQLAEPRPVGAAELIAAYWVARLDPPIVLLPAVGGLAWTVAAVATGLALRRERAWPWPAAAALWLAGVLFSVDHVPPWGPAAMLRLRDRRQPGPLCARSRLFRPLPRR